MIDLNNPEKVIEEFSFAWGVYDCDDKCWVGNEDGPLLYTGSPNGPIFDGQYLARAAATIVNERMEQSCRFRARLYEGGPVRIRDEVTFRRSAEDAIQRIEGRAG